MSSFAFSQSKTVKGTIKDEYNEPFLGVNIVVEGTNIGTVADIDGNYSIQLNNEDAVLVFSYLGYEDSKYPVAGKTLINVAMKPDIESLDAVVITTGIRASQLSAVKAKRNAATVIEAITPEDIGSFSDTNVADALQRVAGVQIERDVDGISGDRVSIRGIGPEFVSVTMNGRSPISAGNEGKSDFRKFNLNVIPSEIISGARIHKTTQAKETSTAIGGTVDFQTIRPLESKYKDGKNYFGSLNARGTSNSEFEDIDFDQRFSGVFGGKISEKLGVAVAVIYSDEVSRKEEVSLRNFNFVNFREDTNADGIFDASVDKIHDSILAPNVINNTLNFSTEERIATSIALQWKPNEQLDFVFDYNRTSVDSKANRQSLQIGLSTGGDSGLLGGNHIFSPGDLIVSGNNLRFISPSSDVNSSPRFSGRNQFFDNLTTNNILGLQTTYTPTDKLKLIVDVSYSDLNFFQNLTQVQAQVTSDKFDNTELSVDTSGDRAVFTFPDEAFDPSLTEISRVTRRHIRTQGYNYATKIDAEYKFNDNATTTFGARYAKTTFETRENAAEVADLDAIEGNLQDLISGEFSGVGFNGGGSNGLAGGWLTIPGREVLDLIPGFTSLNGGSIFDFDIDLEDVQSEPGNLEFNPGRSYGAEETSTDFFTQIDIKTELFELPVDLNFGVRAIRTGNFSKGFSSLSFLNVGDDPTTFGDVVQDSEREYFEVKTSRWDVLPSFNANFELHKRAKLRLGVARGVSRPRYRDIIPNNEVTFVSNIPAGTDLATSPTIRGEITSGNPDLKPYSAWMFDTTLEFYSKNGGAFIVSTFYKQLNNYIARSTLENQQYPGEELLGIGIPPGQEDLLFTINKPTNITDGQIYGFEVGFNQSFSYLSGFLKDFGLQANYSYVDSGFDGAVGDATNGFPGTSKHNANGVLYYEKAGYSFRFTAAYRGDYLSNLGGVGSSRSDEAAYTEGTTTLGVTLKKNFLQKKLQVSAGVSNLTGVDVRRYTDDNTDNFSAYFDRDPVWKVGLRYKL